MEQPKTWGLRITGLRAIGLFLSGAGIGFVVILATVLFGHNSLGSVAEGVLDLLELWALILSLSLALQRPALFGAVQSLRSDNANQTLRTWTAAMFQLVAASLALIGYVGLVLFIENTNVAGTTVGNFLFDIEPTLWFNGPVSLLLVCTGVVVYLISVIIQ